MEDEEEKIHKHMFFTTLGLPIEFLLLMVKIKTYFPLEIKLY